MVKTKNICKAFCDNEVLKGINVEIEHGQIVSVLGPSGTGKTTLLRCINFLERADEGEITIGDLTVSCKNASKKEILALRRKTAMVFQSYNLFANKNVVENVMEGLIHVKSMPKKAAREEAMLQLEKVGMADKASYYPSQISGGQAQRVGIARALALSPEIILFDEPTSALDPELSGEVLKTIQKVSGEGIAMMIVTHEIAFAREISDKIIFMEEGRVIEEGTPEQIFLSPREGRTLEFLRQYAKS